MDGGTRACGSSFWRGRRIGLEHGGCFGPWGVCILMCVYTRHCIQQYYPCTCTSAVYMGRTRGLWGSAGRDIDHSQDHTYIYHIWAVRIRPLSSRQTNTRKKNNGISASKPHERQKLYAANKNTHLHVTDLLSCRRSKPTFVRVSVLVLSPVNSISKKFMSKPLHRPNRNPDTSVLF